MFIAILADGGEFKCQPDGVRGMRTAEGGSVRLRGTMWKSDMCRVVGVERQDEGDCMRRQTVRLCTNFTKLTYLLHGAESPTLPPPLRDSIPRPSSPETKQLQ